jgi:hypothetical protein
MTRALLEQALDALVNGVDCMVEKLENMERWEIRKRGDAARVEINSAQSAIAEITTALAQPEPTGDGWLEATIAWEVCASIHEKFAKGKDALYKKRHADFVKHLDECRAKAIAAPPAPDAFEQKLLNNQIANLTEEIADMTAQRDSWIALMDIARDVYDTTAAKALADMNAADIDADRLDAQRYRQNRSTSCSAAHVSIKEYDANMDAAIATVGRP